MCWLSIEIYTEIKTYVFFTVVIIQKCYSYIAILCKQQQQQKKHTPQ